MSIGASSWSRVGAGRSSCFALSSFGAGSRVGAEASSGGSMMLEMAGDALARKTLRGGGVAVLAGGGLKLLGVGDLGLAGGRGLEVGQVVELLLLAGGGGGGVLGSALVLVLVGVPLAAGFHVRAVLGGIVVFPFSGSLGLGGGMWLGRVLADVAWGACGWSGGLLVDHRGGRRGRVLGDGVLVAVSREVGGWCNALAFRQGAERGGRGRSSGGSGSGGCRCSGFYCVCIVGGGHSLIISHSLHSLVVVVKWWNRTKKELVEVLVEVLVLVEGSGHQESEDGR
ncbi:predicted protein [Uncinocarpus reesii 1704]|uniref:Uncharacterized protein n=1 Tax=Uncinocarpus reesii (strain UAMH 1704) TaxID=336963 RepID=C4JDR9_UNCRE|nr:uncharacterized protein UREG_00546 [Uncinocarpus reesii 1704]EEP75699.1 predicted protein [Uncinocarpus reesii 1704]